MENVIVTKMFNKNLQIHGFNRFTGVVKLKFLFYKKTTRKIVYFYATDVYNEIL